MRSSPDRRQAGFTLVEILLAVAILAVGIYVLSAAASRCLGVIRAAKAYEGARFALDRGELEFPLLRKDDKILNMKVDETEYDGGYTFSRSYDKSKENEGLYIIKSRVTWADRGRTAQEELWRYLYYTNDVE